MKKSINPMKISMIAIAVSSSMAFATVSDNCRQEIIDLPNTKKDFNMSNFPKELVTSVGKAKLGGFMSPGPDDKVMDVGLTVGCVKQLPTNLAGIQALLKDIGMDMGKNMVAANISDSEPMPPPNETQNNAGEGGGAKIGIRAGLNMNSMAMTEGSITFIYDNRVGFHLGMVADIGINSFLYFQPGFMLNTKGMEFNYEEEREEDGIYYNYRKQTISISMYSFQFPLLLSLKGPLSNDLFLRANGGVYIGYAFSAELKQESERESCYYNDCSYDSKNITEDLFADSRTRSYKAKHFYAGIAVGGGIEFRSFYIGMNYDYGLTNLFEATGRRNTEDSDDKEQEIYERTLSFTLGFYF